MHDLDFLPDQYRQRTASRQSQPWRVIVAGAFVLLLAVAVSTQHEHRQQAEEELASIQPQYDLAVNQTNQLTEVQTKLQTDRANAELYTYLRHPWARTQLLAAVLKPLPEGILFRQLEITSELPSGQASTQRRFRMAKKAEEETAEDANLPPAARDLKRLRKEVDKKQTVIKISGTAKQSPALHRYLGSLGNDGLFAKAELDSIENVEGSDAAELQFHATLVVRPGYGQPGGPTGPRESQSVALTRQLPQDEDPDR